MQLIWVTNEQYSFTLDMTSSNVLSAFMFSISDILFLNWNSIHKKSMDPKYWWIQSPFSTTGSFCHLIFNHGHLGIPCQFSWSQSGLYQPDWVDCMIYIKYLQISTFGSLFFQAKHNCTYMANQIISNQKYTTNSRLETCQKLSVTQFSLLFTSTCRPLNFPFSQMDTKQSIEKAMTDQKWDFLTYNVLLHWRFKVVKHAKESNTNSRLLTVVISCVLLWN